MIEQMKTGRYRMRDGRVAVVTSIVCNKYVQWPWLGFVDGVEQHWGLSGEWKYETTMHDLDLVEWLPDDPDDLI